MAISAGRTFSVGLMLRRAAEQCPWSDFLLEAPGGVVLSFQSKKQLSILRRSLRQDEAFGCFSASTLKRMALYIKHRQRQHVCSFPCACFSTRKIVFCSYSGWICMQCRKACSPEYGFVEGVKDRFLWFYNENTARTQSAPGVSSRHSDK
jgi:hypothetical protein